MEAAYKTSGRTRQQKAYRTFLQKNELLLSRLSNVQYFVEKYIQAKLLNVVYVEWMNKYYKIYSYIVFYILRRRES